MKNIVLLFIATALLAAPAGATHIKLFVLTGQSNSLGTTAGGETDPSPGTDPADATIKFLWHNVVDASTSLGDSGGVVTTLQEQQGGYYAGSATHWGPEMAFARTLYRAGVRNFGVVKASRGGGGNTYWSKADGGHMYALITNTVNQAVSDLTASGHTSEVAGFLYLQGESDSPVEAAIAGSRLSTLISNLRADLPNATGMYAVIGGIAAAGTTRDVVRTQQEVLAAGDATISFFSNLDLQGILYDGLHFDKASKFTVGERYAQDFFEAGVVVRDYGRTVIIGDSITQGGNGHPSYRYEVFSHLATNNAAYTFVGTLTGAYNWGAITTPDVNGHSFTNVHDGHWGWRAFWQNGRVALPASRRSANRGEGTILNWTGAATQYELDSAGNWVAYPDPLATTTGCTGTTYTADTAVIMIGANDMGESTIEQLRDDVQLMVQQLQTANPNSMIYLTTVTYLGSGHSAYPAQNDKIDSYNALLGSEAFGWSTADSKLFFIDANTGFDADTMTYDDVHPNAEGEAFIGEKIAEAMGLQVFAEAVEKNTSLLRGRDSSGFASRFNGNQIYDGSSYVNGWSDDQVAESLNEDGSVNFANTTTASDAYVNGTASNSSGSLWTDGNSGDWTLELRVRFNNIENGYALWLGVGTDLILPEIYPDSTIVGGNNVAHSSNEDGEFHLYRVVHDSAAHVYYLWRDGVLLAPLTGASIESTLNKNRMLLGDYTSRDFGDYFDVDIDYVRYDQSGAYPPVKELPKRANLKFNMPRDHLHSLPDGNGSFDSLYGPAWTDPVPNDSLATFSGGGASIRASGVKWESAESWTIEAKLKVTADGGIASGQSTDGFVIWADNGTTIDASGLLRIRTAAVVWGYNNPVYDGGTTIQLLSEDNSSNMHIVRIAYDHTEGRFWIWRNGVLIGDYLEPVVAQANDFCFFGSYSTSITSTAIVDYLAYDTTGAYAPGVESVGTMVVLR